MNMKYVYKGCVTRKVSAGTGLRNIQQLPKNTASFVSDNKLYLVTFDGESAQWTAIKPYESNKTPNQ